MLRHLTAYCRKSYDSAEDFATAIPPFTQHELQKAIKDLKNGKAKDKSGIMAEMIKNGGRALECVLLFLLQ